VTVIFIFNSALIACTLYIDSVIYVICVILGRGDIP